MKISRFLAADFLCYKTEYLVNKKNRNNFLLKNGFYRANLLL